jgi:hypothetical protein
MLAFTYVTFNMVEYATLQNLFEYFCRSTQLQWVHSFQFYCYHLILNGTDIGDGV